MLKLTYSNLEFQNFPREDPGPSSSRGGKEKGGEEREGKGKGRREGKDREGRGGKEGGMGGGGEGHLTWAMPPPQRQALDPPLVVAV